MNAEALRPLAACSDVASLKSAVQELCAGFGRLTRLDVLTVAEAQRRQALCFLRMESAAQEQELIRTLGAARFGEEVLVVVDLPALTPDAIL